MSLENPIQEIENQWHRIEIGLIKNSINMIEIAQKNPEQLNFYMKSVKINLKKAIEFIEAE